MADQPAYFIIIALAAADLIERVERLEQRNKRVEANKAWETSWTRRLSSMAVTYGTVAFYLHFVVHISPWINAVSPSWLLPFHHLDLIFKEALASPLPLAVVNIHLIYNVIKWQGEADCLGPA